MKEQVHCPGTCLARTCFNLFRHMVEMLRVAIYKSLFNVLDKTHATNWTKQNTNSSLPAQRLQQPWVAKPQQLRLSPSPKAEAGWTSHQRVCTATIVAVAAVSHEVGYGFMGYCKFSNLKHHGVLSNDLVLCIYSWSPIHSHTNSLITCCMFASTVNQAFNHLLNSPTQQTPVHSINHLHSVKSLISFICPHWRSVDSLDTQKGFSVQNNTGYHQENYHQSWDSDSGLSLGFL